MCSSYLPEEILFTILSLLPVTSLIRFRAVCNLWLSIISNPEFIETHLAISQKKQASVLTNQFNDPLVYIQSQNKFVRRYPPPQLMKMLSKCCLISSCNGLVCLSDELSKVIYLWNPSTNRFKILPTPNIELHWFGLEINFCFDTISNDYKFFRLGSSISISKPYNVARLELFSANANSWKEIRVPDIMKKFQSLSRTTSLPVINGLLFLEGRDELMSFDLHNEVFRTIMYPDHKRNSCLLDFEGSVAVVCKSLNDESVLSLWKLDDVSGQGFWNKIFSFETNLKIDHVYLNLGGGQFVAHRDGHGYIFYDNIKKEAKKFNFPVHLRDTSVVKYTESLVSLKGFTQEE